MAAHKSIPLIGLEEDKICFFLSSNLLVFDPHFILLVFDPCFTNAMYYVLPVGFQNHAVVPEVLCICIMSLCMHVCECTCVYACMPKFCVYHLLCTRPYCWDQPYLLFCLWIPITHRSSTWIHNTIAHRPLLSINTRNRDCLCSDWYSNCLF